MEGGQAEKESASLPGRPAWDPLLCGLCFRISLYYLLWYPWEVSSGAERCLGELPLSSQGQRCHLPGAVSAICLVFLPGPTFPWHSQLLFLGFCLSRSFSTSFLPISVSSSLCPFPCVYSFCLLSVCPSPAPSHLFSVCTYTHTHSPHQMTAQKHTCIIYPEWVFNKRQPKE